MEDWQKNMTSLSGFSPVSSTPVYWKARKRSGTSAFRFTKRYICWCLQRHRRVAMRCKSSDVKEDAVNVDKSIDKPQESSPLDKEHEEPTDLSTLSEKRKALFEPLVPMSNTNSKRPSAESLLPPPDFESASYPKGWLIEKKRKLVNVDVLESMRRIAVQEMNRKDREIDGLNKQLEERAIRRGLSMPRAPSTAAAG